MTVQDGRRTTAPRASARAAYADNLKVALVAGVVVAHAVMAWTGLEGAWVLSEPPVRDPLLSVLKLAAVVATLFGMALFFLVAGMFTPASLQRKGFRRFAADRALRLLVPSLLYVLLLSPFVEYVDSDNVGWTRGFPAFAVHVWTSWPPPPGPTWFLGVLFVFSVVYGAVRSAPRSRLAPATARPLRARHLVVAAAAVAVTSFALRTAVPLGHEVWHLSVAQAPAWATGFVLGVLGGERGWFEPMRGGLARAVRMAAWVSIAACVALVAAVAPTEGTDPLFGGATWQSLLFTAVEGAVVVTVSLWLLDLFRRRLDHQGRSMRRWGHAAYGAFLVHQGVLVALVLVARRVPWPPEVEFVGVACLGVTLSFLLGAALRRVPGLSRVVG